MLFKTIYGPELKSIFLWIKEYGPVCREGLYDSFLADSEEGLSSSANLKNALSFLKTVKLIYKDEAGWKTDCQLKQEDFLLVMLQNIRKIQLQKIVNDHPLDPYFLEVLESLFIKPDIQFSSNLYKSINNFNLPQTCSKEKIVAWKRILEYIGLGHRGYRGFLVKYNPKLIMEIISRWSDNDEGPLQYFLERYFQYYLPWENKQGNISKVLKNCLRFLESKGCISLLSKQDLPNKSYFKSKNINWIRKEKAYEITLP